jgi:hypothetical protein
VTQTKLGAELKIRPAEPTDLNFIFDSFRASISFDAELGRDVSRRVFVREFMRTIDEILKVSKVAVACKADEPDIILGYLVYDHKIQFCFVKMAFRQMGIARALADHAGFSGKNKIETPFQTKMSIPIFESHPQLKFKPLYQWALIKKEQL